MVSENRYTIPVVPVVDCHLSLASLSTRFIADLGAVLDPDAATYVDVLLNICTVEETFASSMALIMLHNLYFEHNARVTHRLEHLQVLCSYNTMRLLNYFEYYFEITMFMQRYRVRCHAELFDN